jgi:excisionase family DNA binding protein
MNDSLEPLLLTQRQAALLLNVSERTIRRLLRDGELVRRKVGAKTLIPRTSVQSFVKRDHAIQPEKGSES